MIKVLSIDPNLTEATAEAAINAIVPEARGSLHRMTVCWATSEPVLGSQIMPFKGLAVAAWFDDKAAAARALGYTDVDGLVAAKRHYLFDERVVVPGPDTPFPETGVRMFSHIKRLPELSADNMRTYWYEKHALLVKKTPLLRRYVQDHLLPIHYAEGAEPPMDGVAELWWDTVEIYRKSWASEEIQKEQANDCPYFIGMSDCFCITKEKTLLGN